MINLTVAIGCGVPWRGSEEQEEARPQGGARHCARPSHVLLSRGLLELRLDNYFFYDLPSQFVSAEDGVMGLAQYGNSAGMRISFAKDPISVLREQCKEKEMELIEGDQRAT